MRNRVLFDIVLTLALVFEMLYQFTGNLAHEIVGALFFCCIIAHLALNRKWIGSIPKSVATRSMAKRNKLLFGVACLLAVDVLLLAFSSLIISEQLWRAGVNLSALNPGNVWYPIHVGSSYALCILVLLHLSLHWVNVADALKIEYDPSRREAISSGVNAVFMIGAVALGIGGIMRTSYEASDFSVDEDGEIQGPKTVASGYRERNAETGKVTEGAEAANLRIENASAGNATSAESEPRCPLCPRNCKLSAPRCKRPYEEGLIS